MIKYLFILFLIPTLISCSALQRSDESGYADYGSLNSTAKEYYNNQKDYQTEMAKKELLIPQTRPLSEYEAKKLSLRLRLKRLEDKLHTSEVKKQYYGLKPYFKSDSERIMFLRLPSVTARKRWANARGIGTSLGKFSPLVSDLIENNDISLGMTKTAVKESWGEPDLVEVAGNELYGNERWNYIKVSSTPDGYKKENRIVYFESSRVAGWETQGH